MTKNETKNSGELMLYGTISQYSWWDDEVTPQQFADDLGALGDIDELTVRVNSGGGDVFAGLAIHNMIKRHKATVTAHVDGLAASIASIIIMAADKIVMPRGSMIMIHNPWSSVWGGEASDFRQAADVLDKIRDALIEVYQGRTSLDTEELKTLMDAETWMTATEAVEKGFADETDAAVPVSASMSGGKMAVFNGLKIDFSRFQNAPKLQQAPVVPVAAAVPTPAPKPIKGDEILNLAELKEKHPDLFAAAVAEGVQNERSRITELNALAGAPGAADIVAKAITDGKTAAQAAVEIVQASMQRLSTEAAARAADSHSSNAAVVPAEGPTPQVSAEAAAQAEADAIVAEMKKLRGGK
ncbi:head maturation protease, ClpP-related [Paenibacillus sp. P22]|uniref:head maturation protease, ClpP-related n=1 Tax=Paenibacillus sp. P22 TaxID=483908 RepID=UPI000434236E|nr:head maturation protease, ClpP-related [Paenibacillus sp. P22]CDN41449.1 hypothetical protein BN871_AH_00230 [Paenibacillus sp. P22]